MTSPQPIDDIIKWSDEKLVAWQRDALRRLACGGSLGEDDQAELLAMVKVKAGLAVVTKPPAPNPLAKAHFSGAVPGISLKLVGVRNIQNINRLEPGARVDFAQGGLTVIYGRNGSGKSGFVRILRTACRTRIESPAKLKVLSNVYGGPGGPQQAEIVIAAGAGETVIPWSPDAGPSEQLLQVAVFDSAAASLYVDQGHQIRFLPFGLALPHKLNELCLALRATLDAERAVVTQKLDLAVVKFETERETRAQAFYRNLSGNTTDSAIDGTASFMAADEERLTALNEQLAADPDSSADLHALASWSAKLGQDCVTLSSALSDEGLGVAEALACDARDKREAASLDAGALFQNEPLPGVGAGAWRALWKAARDYSLADAYLGRDFPVVAVDDKPGSCVLCQQPLGTEAVARLQRFQEFMEGALSTAAVEAEAAAVDALEKLPRLGGLEGGDWLDRVAQLAARDEDLADRVTAFKLAAAARRARAQTLLMGGAEDGAKLAAIVSPSVDLAVLAERLAGDADARAKSGDDTFRAGLQAEVAELVDRKHLAANVGELKTRRDLLKHDAAYRSAISELHTKAITEAANRFVDAHLTSKVVERFDGERKILEIDHLQIGLARKSGQTKATFQTDPGTTLTKNASEILSEGEQRALALSAFLTEVAMTDGSGPIVVDDPVSSLDRERCVSVAMRLAAEAQVRQVIVFTHDLVFFNDVCREAANLDVPVAPVALFSNKVDAGKVDPAGVTWKGLPVKKRLALIKAEFPPVKALQATSQANYEFNVKGLYGRLRDTYERVVEECIFYQVVTRGADRVETLKLRYVHLSDGLALRFHEGMTRANTYSHDNPAAETVQTPEPHEFEADLAHLELLVADLEAECKAAENRRPAMKPTKP